MKRVQIAVRDFALPVPRSGSIEVLSGYSVLPVGGDEAHRIAQSKRARELRGYKTEVRLSHSFEHRDYTVVVSGRIDGLVESNEKGVTIEEIKTAFDAHELLEKLKHEPAHPYCLQLQTYAYIYSLQNAFTPKLSFHLVSYVTGAELDLNVPFDPPQYERWLALRLDEVVFEAEENAADRQRRLSAGARLTFPFDRIRSGQRELIDTIERTLPEGDSLLLQAPTGLGKTAGIMFPMMRDAFARGQKLIYVTPKNSQHQVAEEVVNRINGRGHEVRSLTLTAKSKICFKGEPICNPDHCEFARDYYAKTYKHDLPKKAAASGSMNAQTFKDLGEQYEVCPFELSIDTIPYADVVIGDYNYVFSPRGLLGRFTADPLGAGSGSEAPNLVVDEAHNLPARAADYFSPSIGTSAVNACRERLESLGLQLRMEGAGLLQQCKAAIAKYEPKPPAKQALISTKPGPATDSFVALFMQLDSKLSEFANDYLKEVKEPKPGDPILGFCRQWAEFTEMLLRVVTESSLSVSDAAGAPDQRPQASRFFITATREVGTCILKICCCDAAEEIAACMKEFEHVVVFSATLKPFDYYRKLIGLAEDRVREVEFQSPFSRAKRKVMVIPQVSTKYSDREANYQKIAGAIERITALKPGNYFVFFPSFEFLRKVFEMVALPDFVKMQQQPGTTHVEVQKILEHLRSQSHPTVVFAVQGGVFAEGVDYPGDMLIGAFVVGPALPGWDIERETIRQYYEDKFGNGFDYAYTYPAMARVVQAAGRVIRSETDSGLIVLMDKRFTMPAYSGSMPKDWFDSSISELVSAKVLSDIDDFWKSVDSISG